MGHVKLVLVHDWLNQIGGAEDVLEHLVSYYPDAPVYTSMYAPGLMPDAYRAWDIRCLWTDRLPGIHRHHQRYLPLYPPAFHRLNLSAYDVVLSNKSGFCHGVQTGSETLHICYCLTPTRYVWDLPDHLLVDKTFDCGDGLVRLRLQVHYPGADETFTWTILGGTEAYAGIHGHGSGTTTPTASGVINHYTGFLVG